MMKSLSSAVSGLQAQQTAMDVIGNNISNVNTNGFKSSTTNFEDTFYQTLKSGTSNTNPTQVGSGSDVSNVSKNMTSGGSTSTSKATDLYINGSGYFAVSTSGSATDTKPEYYTRVGNFSFNTAGNLVDSSGNYVLSTAVTTNASGVQTAAYSSPICIANAYYKNTSDTTTTTATQLTAADYNNLSDITFAKDGSITASLNGNTISLYQLNSGSATATTPATIPLTNPATGTPTTSNKMTIGLASFVNEAGLQSVGSNYYAATQSSGSGAASTPGLNGDSTTLQSGYLEGSNVDLGSEFTKMITTERGFQANSRVITTSDTMLGELIDLKRS